MVGIILEYRELAKLINTYLKGYPDHIGTDNRIHSRLNPFRVITGRLASTEPNLMNIPIRTDNGKSIRRLFEGEGEHVLLSADAAHLEYRILAHYSKPRTLVDAFSAEHQTYQRLNAYVQQLLLMLVSMGMLNHLEVTGHTYTASIHTIVLNVVQQNGQHLIPSFKGQQVVPSQR